MRALIEDWLDIYSVKANVRALIKDWLDLFS